MEDWLWEGISPGSLVCRKVHGSHGKCPFARTQSWCSVQHFGDFWPSPHILLKYIGPVARKRECENSRSNEVYIVEAGRPAQESTLVQCDLSQAVFPDAHCSLLNGDSNISLTEL